MRSYAPFVSFGDLGLGIGFEGDARGPSLSSSDTARVTSIAVLDVAKKTVTFRAFSNESAWPALPFKHASHSYWPALIAHLQFTATAKPTVVGTLAVGADGSLTIIMSHAGALPLIPGSPDIDLHTTFVLTFEGGKLRIQTSMVGDAFPNAEAYARINGQAYMLHHFETRGDPGWGPLMYLEGDFRRDMGSDTVIFPLSSGTP